MKPLFIAILPLIASAQMSITTNEQVSAMLTPDVLQGSLSFEEQNKNANVIKEHLNAIVAEVKRVDPKSEHCRGGGYHISPRYNYKDQKQEFIGYSGSLYFGCEFSQIEEYNTLIAKIDKVTERSVRKTEGELSWGVSEKHQRATQKELRTTLLQTAKQQAVDFSKVTVLSCNVSMVNFGGIPMVAQQPMLMMKSMAMADSAVATESPIQRNEESTLSATVSYICQ